MKQTQHQQRLNVSFVKRDFSDFQEFFLMSSTATTQAPTTVAITTQAPTTTASTNAPGTQLT
jgi:hypothetical protein